MSIEKIEKMKAVFQNDKDKSMQIKAIVDACLNYVKIKADVENAYSTIKLQIVESDWNDFRGELDKNVDIALKDIKQALQDVNDLAKEADLPVIYKGDYDNVAELSAYASKLMADYFSYKQK